MSLSGLSLIGSIYQALQSSRSQGQNIRSEFQQLGQDLQAGNLTQATTDFTTLSQSLPASLQAGSNCRRSSVGGNYVVAVEIVESQNTATHRVYHYGLFSDSQIVYCRGD